MTGFWLVESNGTCKNEKRLEIYQGTDNFTGEGDIWVGSDTFRIEVMVYVCMA